MRVQAGRTYKDGCGKHLDILEIWDGDIQYPVRAKVVRGPDFDHAKDIGKEETYTLNGKFIFGDTEDAISDLKEEVLPPGATATDDDDPRANMNGIKPAPAVNGNFLDEEPLGGLPPAEVERLAKLNQDNFGGMSDADAERMVEDNGSGAVLDYIGTAAPEKGPSKARLKLQAFIYDLLASDITLETLQNAASNSAETPTEEYSSKAGAAAAYILAGEILGEDS